MADTLGGKWALITGVSNELGAELAYQLGASGANLVLVAEHQDRLRAVADDIMQRHSVRAETILLDLAQPDAPQTLFDQLKSAGRDIDILVNSAGFGLYGRFVDLDWAREAEMLQINMVMMVQLIRLFAAEMVLRGAGHILNISSAAAFQPSPLYAGYSASRAFALNFSEAINYELRGTGVSVTVSCPGVAASFPHAAVPAASWHRRLTHLPVADVARISVRAMLRRQASVVPGVFHRAAVFITRLLPRQISIYFAARLMRRD